VELGMKKTSWKYNLEEVIFKIFKKLGLGVLGDLAP
jgi:hypothetical protein